MASIRLTPSSYYLSSSSYLSVSNADSMYDDTDSTDYATVYNSRASTSSYYIYLRGFNFDEIPAGAVVSSFTIKLKAYESGVSTSDSYKPYLANGTTAINGSCSAITATASVHTFSGISADWEDIKGYGENFGIRINCRRASRNTAGYVYIYGAEILVEYTVPDPATVTSTLTGSGTIDPSGAYNTYEGREYTLTITPTNKSDTVTVKNNGTDVTSQLVAHGSEATETATPESATTSGIQSGASYAQYAIGHSAENPYSSTSNMYASSGSTGYAEYSFDFSRIPSNAVIESVEVRCNGHRESNTISSTYVSQCVLYRNGTAISDEVDFPSTNNSTITLEPSTLPTRAELDDVTVRHFVGYYGGLVLGISFEVVYSTGSGLDHYTYTFTVTGDATIAVVIGGTVTPPVITIGIPDKSRISDETGCRECLCTFTADQALTQWEARAVKNGVTPARGVGLLVESGTNLPAGTAATVSVIDTELTDGDGVYLIAVYGCNAGGAWNE